MKPLLTFYFLLSTFYLSAQKTSFPFFNNIKGDRKVFADTAILRVAPSTGAAINDTLFLGDNINILMQVPYSEVRNNIVSPWLKITYKKGAFSKVAFISSIDVALNEKLAVKDVEVVFGLVRNEKIDSIANNEIYTINNYNCKAIVFKKNKNVADLFFNLPPKFSVDSLSVAVLQKTKLKKTIAAMSFILNSKNDEEGMYKLNFVLCNANKIVQLPTTHNYLVQLSKNWGERRFSF